MPLFVVATPIGNMGDITVRAVEALREADLVLAEDTRRARSLLGHLGIAGKTVHRLDANALARDVDRVAARALSGEKVALVTDAGTPVVSDPGSAVVAAVRAAGGEVVPIPGVSAVTAAMSVCGYAANGFRFAAFLPRGGPERTRALASLVADPDAIVMFEAPHRMKETLGELARVMPRRRMMVARELTKMHEELIEGFVDELAEKHGDREWLGEITIVIGPGAGPGEGAASLDDEALSKRVDELLGQGRRPRDVAEIVALEAGRPKREVYSIVVARRPR